MVRELPSNIGFLIDQLREEETDILRESLKKIKEFDPVLFQDALEYRRINGQLQVLDLYSDEGQVLYLKSRGIREKYEPSGQNLLSENARRDLFQMVLNRATRLEGLIGEGFEEEFEE